MRFQHMYRTNRPKAIIDEIKRISKKTKIDDGEDTPDLFADWAQELLQRIRLNSTNTPRNGQIDDFGR